MPTRMIRESLIDSERYLSINDSERVLFIHLLLLSDDLGCINLAPAFLGRRAFAERPTDARLSRMLQSLSDVDLLRIYEHNGARYGFIPRFRQRLQRETLKHPAPPTEMLQDQKEALEMFNRIKQKQGKITVGQRLGNGSPTVPQPPEVEVEGKRREVEVKKAVDKSQVKTPAELINGRPSFLYKKPDDIDHF